MFSGGLVNTLYKDRHENNFIYSKTSDNIQLTVKSKFGQEILDAQFCSCMNILDNIMYSAFHSVVGISHSHFT